MDSGEIKPEQPGSGVDLSSGGGNSDSSGSRGGTGRGRIWKTGVFVAVALLASGLAAHSLLTVSRCGGCGAGRWMKGVAGGGSAQAGTRVAAYSSDKSCCPGAEASFKSGGCPLARQAEPTCPNSPSTPAPGGCPGRRHRWGQR